MARGPAGSADVVKSARPSDRETLSRTLSPSLKVTVPVGVPPVPVMTAVNATELPATLVVLDAVTSI
jgi:hypothetical protein